MEEKKDLLSIDGLVNEKGWFCESPTELWPGQALCIQYKKVLFHERSKYQDVLVLESANYGNVLVLDGIIQVTQRDQHAYAEMIAHLPLFAHEDPRHVLLIGGGDGAALCEILKHKSVESATICEIDTMVIEVSKKYFPEYAHIWNHPKLTLFTGDGAEFLKNHKKSFDVIIIDSSDPLGPSASLFEKQFYENCRVALKKGGILCSLGEPMWLGLDLIAGIVTSYKELFPSVQYAYTTIPTYGGEIGFVIASKKKKGKLSKAKRSAKKALGKKNVKTLKYYNVPLHSAAFVLPAFVAKGVNKKI